MAIHNQGIKRLSSFNDPAPAGLGSLPAGEAVDRVHSHGAGRPQDCGEKRMSICGGQRRCESMKRNEESRGGEPLNQLRGMITFKMAFLLNKAIGIDGINKIVTQLCSLEVA
jgi:hypothetical protein